MKISIKVKPITKQITVIDNEATGGHARWLRKMAKLSLRRVAAAMEVSPPYLSDLELGRRNWSNETFDRFIEALDKATTATKKQEGGAK